MNFLGQSNWQDNHGGKNAQRLHDLLKQGMSIPRGFVVTADDSLSFDALSAAIQKLGGFPVSVRLLVPDQDLGHSSYVVPNISFANVVSMEELTERIRICRVQAKGTWLKSTSPRFSVKECSSHFGVLVQKIVCARWSGVAFALHPNTGRQEHALIELCSGWEEPEGVHHSRPTRIVMDLETGGVVLENLGPRGARVPDKVLMELRDTLLSVSAHFGSPQELEWAIDLGGKLWILHSRPLKRIAWRQEKDLFCITGRKNREEPVRVCTPMMYSLCRDAVNESLPSFLRSIGVLVSRRGERWIDTFYGRVYWNATALKRSLALMPGLDREKFDRDLGINISYKISKPPRAAFGGFLALQKVIILFTTRDNKKKLQQVAEFRHDFEKRDSRWRRQITKFVSTSDEDFFAELSKVLGQFSMSTEIAYWKAMFHALLTRTRFESFLQRLDKTVGGKTIPLTLLSRFPSFASVRLEPDFGVSLATDKTEEVLAGHGKFSAAFTFATGAIARDRKKVSKELCAFDGEAIAEVEKRIASFTEGPWRRARAFFLRRQFMGQLARSSESLRMHEEMHSYSLRALYVTRQYLLEAGRRLQKLGFIDRAQQIFFFDWKELLSLASIAVVTRETLVFREKMFLAYQEFSPPDQIGCHLEDISLGKESELSAEAYFKENLGAAEILHD